MTWGCRGPRIAVLFASACLASAYWLRSAVIVGDSIASAIAVHYDKATDHKEQLDTKCAKALYERHREVECFAVREEIRAEAVEQMNCEHHQHRERP
jgi:hypothetical protein